MSNCFHVCICINCIASNQNVHVKIKSLRENTAMDRMWITNGDTCNIILGGNLWWTNKNIKIVLSTMCTFQQELIVVNKPLEGGIVLFLSLEMVLLFLLYYLYCFLCIKLQQMLKFWTTYLFNYLICTTSREKIGILIVHDPNLAIMYYCI